jgi:hypothetical protein
MRSVDVTPDQRMEHNKLVEQLHRFSQELDQKLPMYLVALKSEEVIKSLVSIVGSAH